MTVATDEIYEKYLQKAITEINALGDEVAQAGAEPRVPVVGSGHPARRRLPAQVRAARVGAAGGRRVLRTRRQRAPEVAAAAARRPDGDLRHELPEVRGRRRRGVAAVPPARAAHRPAEARRRDGRAGASRSSTPSKFPLARELDARPTASCRRSRRRSTRSSRRTSTRRSTSSRRRRRSGTRFKLLGDWWASLPPY